MDRRARPILGWLPWAAYAGVAAVAAKEDGTMLTLRHPGSHLRHPLGDLKQAVTIVIRQEHVKSLGPAISGRLQAIM